LGQRRQQRQHHREKSDFGEHVRYRFAERREYPDQPASRRRVFL
jgi:hypothetical protein